jgi:hypothetical protein
MNTLSKVGGIAAVLLGLLASTASAHTVTIGYENAGPGSVTFWYGSYHTHGGGDGPDLEGSMTLQGVNGTVFPLTQVAFTLDTGTQPAGLINDVTNFLDANYASNYASNAAAFATVFSWQGVTFSNLAPGDYQFTYIPIANPSAHWAPWSEDVRTGTVTLSGVIVGNSVPDAGSSALLLGAGLLALVGASRKFRK